MNTPSDNRCPICDAMRDSPIAGCANCDFDLDPNHDADPPGANGPSTIAICIRETIAALITIAIAVALLAIAWSLLCNQDTIARVIDQLIGGAS